MRPKSYGAFLFFGLLFSVLSQDGVKSDDNGGLDLVSSGYISEKTGNILQNSEKVLAVVDKSVSEIAEALAGADLAGIFGKIAVGPVFMAFSAVMSIVSIFLPAQESPEMQAINRGFEKVNNRLSGMQSTIQEIKVLTEISSAKSSIVESLDCIESMERELLIARKRGSHVAWDYYKQVYENDYKGAADAIYWALIGEDGTTGEDEELRFDMLKLYKEKFKCSVTALTRVCLVGMQTINRGLVLEGAYLATIKFPGKVKEDRIVWHKRMEALRERCGRFIVDCDSGYWPNIQKTFREFWEENNHKMSSFNFAHTYQSFASSVAPAKKWVVFASERGVLENMNFFMSYVAGDKYEIFGQGVKNGLVMTVKNKSPVTDLEETKKQWQKLKESIEGDECCAWNCQGPLYWGLVSHPVTQFASKFPDVTFIGALERFKVSIAHDPARLASYSFGPNYCFTEKLILWAIF